ncbi:hypothetical protein J6590_059120 [Homalodisca vitripennis]|nr:hypothetical protein J6590_059120 [Homalodisca vitripennis]
MATFLPSHHAEYPEITSERPCLITQWQHSCKATTQSTQNRKPPNGNIPAKPPRRVPKIASEYSVSDHPMTTLLPSHHAEYPEIVSESLVADP